MLEPALPPDESARLQALYRYDVLDTPAEEVFDRITRVAGALADVPMCLISLIDIDRQWFKSRVGIDATETPRRISFCAHALLGEGPLVVPDALKDERFAGNPAVTGPLGVRFYLGIPLEVPEGPKIGTLCVIDSKPRELSEITRQRLHDLAMMVVRELELRKVATTDVLTGALNRRMLLRMIGQEASRCARAGNQTFSFAMVDLDHFKKVNDTWGHDTGDRVLEAAADACRSCLRAQDTLFRLGGEEFGILFVETPLAAAAEAAERIRVFLAGRTIRVGQETIAVTASIGVAQYRPEDADPTALTVRADKALYRAKQEGRNRVEISL